LVNYNTITLNHLTALPHTTPHAANHSSEYMGVTLGLLRLLAREMIFVILARLHPVERLLADHARSHWGVLSLTPVAALNLYPGHGVPNAHWGRRDVAV
jgi:hypothetical protein